VGGTGARAPPAPCSTRLRSFVGRRARSGTQASVSGSTAWYLGAAVTATLRRDLVSRSRRTLSVAGDVDEWCQRFLI